MIKRLVFITQLLLLSVGFIFTISAVSSVRAAMSYPFTWCLPAGKYDVSDQLIKIATLPHHELAKETWQPVLKNWQQHNVKKVIILAPDHNWKGRKGVTTSSVSLRHNDVTLPTDATSLSLLKTGVAGDDGRTIEGDHSATIFYPDLKQSLPELSVVPVLLKKNISSVEVEALTEFITLQLKDEQTVILASVDFSHYLLPGDAYYKDVETIGLVMNNKIEEISDLSEAYLDAPPVMTVIMNWSKQNNKKMSLRWQGHAGQFSNNCFQPTTTYQIWNVID